MYLGALRAAPHGSSIREMGSSQGTGSLLVSENGCASDAIFPMGPVSWAARRGRSQPPAQLALIPRPHQRRRETVQTALQTVGGIPDWGSEVRRGTDCVPHHRTMAGQCSLGLVVRVLFGAWQSRMLIGISRPPPVISRV